MGTHVNLHECEDLNQIFCGFERDETSGDYRVSLDDYEIDVLGSQLERAVEELILTNPDAILGLGERSLEKKEYQKAFRYIYPAATNQNAQALYLLGPMQMKGLGIPANHTTALENFSRACEKNHVDAMYHYALMHHKGLGTKVDLKKAFDWYLKAAGKGHAASYYLLGRMYEGGKGIDPHHETAKKCYLQAAQLGHAQAMYRIGFWYLESEKNEEAVKWLKKATKQAPHLLKYCFKFDGNQTSC